MAGKIGPEHNEHLLSYRQKVVSATARTDSGDITQPQEQMMEIPKSHMTSAKINKIQFFVSVIGSGPGAKAPYYYHLVPENQLNTAIPPWVSRNSCTRWVPGSCRHTHKCSLLIDQYLPGSRTGPPTCAGRVPLDKCYDLYRYII